MRIEFERSGGFANIRVAGAVDTESLPPQEAQALSDLVNKLDFFALPSVIPSVTGGADRFQYTLTVEDEGRRHTVELPESAATGDFANLIGSLTALARRGS
ncbi:MAG: hypothetical protein HZC41_08010 [Chloroflexi bacterium]|nr:hypothetical protein [Chloroflexota bacterium]